MSILLLPTNPQLTSNFPLCQVFGFGSVIGSSLSIGADQVTVHLVSKEEANAQAKRDISATAQN